jgi:hypothetical protein
VDQAKLVAIVQAHLPDARVFGIPHEGVRYVNDAGRNIDLHFMAECGTLNEFRNAMRRYVDAHKQAAVGICAPDLLTTDILVSLVKSRQDCDWVGARFTLTTFPSCWTLEIWDGAWQPFGPAAFPYLGCP